MALIKEPLDVDFFVEAQPLSDIERKTISDYIINYKKECNYPAVAGKLTIALTAWKTDCPFLTAESIMERITAN